MPTHAILVAAGAGTRMGAGVPKALMPLAGRPMVAWSAEALAASRRLAGLVVVAPPGREDELAAAVPVPVAAVVAGGDSRADSVRRGLEAVPSAAAAVLVHDAARPLVWPGLVGRVLDAIAGDAAAAGAIAAAPVVDTLKWAASGGPIGRTVPREGLWAAQTPQAFRAAALRGAVASAVAAGRLGEATDCASMVEAVGGRVLLVAAEAPNLKVTTPADRVLAEAILAERARG